MSTQKKHHFSSNHHPQAISRNSSPMQKKNSLNQTKKDFLVPIANTKKKFNVRRLTNTQQSNKCTEDITKLKQASNSVNMRKIQDSIDLRKVGRFNSIRMHTQKMNNSPYRFIKPLNTIDHDESANHKKYQHFTDLQKQQLDRFEMYYSGKRRISSLKQFTDHNGDAKISIGDSIMYRYQIKNLLGKGSFGQVFKAYDHKKKEYCALKIIRNHPKFTAQAKIQIKILEHAIIKDPKFKANIVQLKHGFFFRGHACLCFELLHINLYQFIKSFNYSGLSLDLIRRFAIQILQGLQFLRKYDIVHCDLKPQNILLKQQNKTGIKIIDLGSGCYRNQQLYTYIQSRFYRAPQIILGITYSPAIDMWSFGCILCELLTGYPIFPGQNQQEQIQMFMQILNKPPNKIIDAGCRSGKFFDNYEPKLKQNSHGAIRKPRTKKLSKVLECQDYDFVNLVELCFKWDPEERITPTEALLHPFIVEGLPQQLKQQHISKVKNADKIDIFL